MRPANPLEAARVRTGWMDGCTYSYMERERALSLSFLALFGTEFNPFAGAERCSQVHTYSRVACPLANKALGLAETVRRVRRASAIGWVDGCLRTPHATELRSMYLGRRRHSEWTR